MQRVMMLFMMFVVLAVSTPALSKVIFYDDAEDKPNLNTDWLIQSSGSNSITVSGEKVRAGNRSYKVVLAPYGTPGSNTNVELILRGLNSSTQIKNFLYGKEYWVGWSVFIPKDFDFPDSNGNPGCMGQFHGAPDDCDNDRLGPATALGLKKSTGGFVLDIRGIREKCAAKGYDRGASYNSQPLIKGAWNDVVLNFKYDYGDSSNPFFKFWLNGQLVSYDKGINAYNDIKGPYLKMGIYAHADVYMTVYYDEIRVGDETSSYNEVAPKGGAIKDTTLEAPTLRVIPNN